LTGAGQLAGRVVLVTGTTGIAAVAAERFAAEGARLFVTSRSEEHCAVLAGRLQSLGAEVGWESGDLADEAAVDRVFGALIGHHGRLDAVFNVAGISGRSYGDRPLHECTVEGWDTVLETNARSAFLVCRAAVRQLLRQKPGRSGQRGSIVNVSSVLADHPAPRHFATHAYAASKGAVTAFSRAIAAYYAPLGIRMNVIAPGLVRTPMSRRAQSDPAVVRYLRRRQPLANGIIEAEDICGSAVFLLADASAMVTGQVIAVDGGWAVSDAWGASRGPQ
jgi:NAD(P)-dependent dehydrogenase (short-subunit alcohol dehydrogenase family)